MKIKNALNYAKEHKKEILIGTGVVISGVVLAKFGIDWWCKGRKIIITNNEVGESIIEAFGGYTDHEFKLGIGECVGYTTKENWIGADVHNLHISDLGNLGEELAKIPGVTENTEIWSVINMEN